MRNVATGEGNYGIFRENQTTKTKLILCTKSTFGIRGRTTRSLIAQGRNRNDKHAIKTRDSAKEMDLGEWENPVLVLCEQNLACIAVPPDHPVGMNRLRALHIKRSDDVRLWLNHLLGWRTQI